MPIPPRGTESVTSRATCSPSRRHHQSGRGPSRARSAPRPRDADRARDIYRSARASRCVLPNRSCTRAPPRCALASFLWPGRGLVHRPFLPHTHPNSHPASPRAVAWPAPGENIAGATSTVPPAGPLALSSDPPQLLPRCATLSCVRFHRCATACGTRK